MSHPPDFGIFFIRDGKNEKSTKGSENASPKNIIPRMGFAANPPVTAAASIDPTNGPVQENDTITIARATKKEAIIPPLSALASALFARPEGSVISNAPKNDIAKIIKRTANSMFGIQCVPKTSVASVLWNIATITPTSVYISVTDRPNTRPLTIPSLLFPPPLIKKLTVIGIMGNTQGVKTPPRPAAKAISKNTRRPSDSPVSFPDPDTSAGASISVLLAGSPAGISNLTSISSIRHSPPLHV